MAIKIVYYYFSQLSLDHKVRLPLFSVHLEAVSHNHIEY